MVSVLALNKIELKEMIDGELVENPVLEEVVDYAESLEERSAKEGERERSAEEVAGGTESKEVDPFDEIDFGSYFDDYLDPGFRTGSRFEELDAPSFEQFLSQPGTLSDHLLWQIGAMSLRAELKIAIELIIGNLDGDGYLTASSEDLLSALSEVVAAEAVDVPDAHTWEALVEEARDVVSQLDPAGVGARDLRECLLWQLDDCRRNIHGGRHVESEDRNKPSRSLAEIELAAKIVGEHLGLLQKKDIGGLLRILQKNEESVTRAIDLVRSLDPRPGQRYTPTDTRLIEPDVAFVKRDGEYVVVINEDDMPTLRLSRTYRRMLRAKTADREVHEYVKERYKSAIQLLRNIEQRKNTILRTCEIIVQRQTDFLERGVDGLRPMMIKEVAEEIGVHPSTVSRAVANKYVHTAQGVYELRFFFSEGVGGPAGGDMPLALLKRRVKKLIEEENPRKPWTDEYLAAELQRQGIQVTRRTVAKYREDMQIPGTHHRRQR